MRTIARQGIKRPYKEEDSGAVNHQVPGREIGDHRTTGDRSGHVPKVSRMANSQRRLIPGKGQTLQSTGGYAVIPQRLEMTLDGVAPMMTSDHCDWFKLDLTNFAQRPVGLAGNYLYSSCYEPNQTRDGVKFRDQFYSISPQTMAFNPAANRTTLAELLQTKVLEYWCNVGNKPYRYFISLNKAGQLQAFNLDTLNMDWNIRLSQPNSSFTEFDIDYDEKMIYVLGKSILGHVTYILAFQFPQHWESHAIYEVSTQFQVELISKKGTCFIKPTSRKLIITSMKKLLGKAAQVQGNQWKIEYLPRTNISFDMKTSQVKGLISVNPPLMYGQLNDSIRFYTVSPSFDTFSAPPVYVFQHDDLANITPDIIQLPDGSPRIVISHKNMSTPYLVTFKKNEDNSVSGVESCPFDGDITVPVVVRNRNKRMKISFQLLEMAFNKETNLLAVLFGYGKTFTVKIYNPTTFAVIRELPIIKRVDSKPWPLSDLSSVSISYQSDILLVEFVFKSGVYERDAALNKKEILVREVFCGRLMSEIV